MFVMAEQLQFVTQLHQVVVHIVLMQAQQFVLKDHIMMVIVMILIHGMIVAVFSVV